MTRFAIAVALTFVSQFAITTPAQAELPTVRLRVFGLFQPDRVADLQHLMQEIEEADLEQVDYEQAEATFALKSQELFANANDEQIVQRLDSKIRGVTRGTFSVLPLSEVPPDQLQQIEIAVVGLDCKACSFAAYEAVAKVEGVQRARASFKEGKVTAWIDPQKTDRAALEEALKKRQVQLATP